MSSSSPTPEAIFTAFRASMLANDGRWEDLIVDDVKLSAPLAQVEGRDAFIELNRPFFASIRESELHRKVVSGPYVVTEITTTVAAPGSVEFPLDVSEWYEIRHGKITALRTYFDASALRAQAAAEHTQP